MFVKFTRQLDLINETVKIARRLRVIACTQLYNETDESKKGESIDPPCMFMLRHSLAQSVR